MTDERLAELRAELSLAGYVVNTTKFWEAAADAIRWQSRELAKAKIEAQKA